MRIASGKFVIISIVAVAFAAAGTSWLFRLQATHRAANFWGPDGARLIRDAPIVLLVTDTPVPTERDVSSARGLVHMRNALLEDRSFKWPPRAITIDVKWQHGLVFSDEVAGDSLPLSFSSDFRWVTVMDSETMLSCEPIAAGLREMFTEFEDRR